MEPQQNQIQLAREIQVSKSCKLMVLKATDSQVLFNCVDNNRHHLETWLPWVEFTEYSSDSSDFIEIEEHAYLLAERVSYGIFIEDTLIGMIAFHEIDWDNKQAAIGYWISLGYQGKGFVTRACNRLINYGFTDLKLKKIIIRCATENYRSRAVAERLGFELEGVLTANEKVGNVFLDHAVYGLVIEKWKIISASTFVK
jgi:ribosomal-protein-serine acetyltransferase